MQRRSIRALTRRPRKSRQRRALPRRRPLTPRPPRAKSLDCPYGAASLTPSCSAVRTSFVQSELWQGMGRKILLVEDDRETASYLAKGLTQEGHSVEQATNGQDGLFRATDGSFDLIILDRMLPVLDGLSVLRALRAARIETPVLILSALASVGDRIEGLEQGSDDYLVKPFSFAELLARVNALLRRRESRVDPAEHRLTVGDLEIDPLSRSVKR